MYCVCQSHDSSVEIATGWTAGVPFPAGSGILLTVSRPFLVPTQPPIKRVLRAFSQGVKRPGREANRLPSSSAEVKNGGAVPPVPNMSPWHNAKLIKHKDNLPFYLYYLYRFTGLGTISNHDVRSELGICELNEIIPRNETSWLQHVGTMEGYRLLKCTRILDSKAIGSMDVRRDESERPEGLCIEVIDAPAWLSLLRVCAYTRAYNFAL
jgi:hypothetical protein